MSKSVFERALDYVFENEGGFSNIPADKGGATRYGITRSEAARWRRAPVSVEDMRHFPIEEAKLIYKEWYWNTLSLDKVTHPGIQIAMFDIGVVRGIGVPPKYAQLICNQNGNHLTVDGHIGPLTVAAINSMSQKTFVHDFSAKVADGFRSIVANKPTQRIFLSGWLARAHRLLGLSDII